MRKHIVQIVFVFFVAMSIIVGVKMRDDFIQTRDKDIDAAAMDFHIDAGMSINTYGNSDGVNYQSAFLDGIIAKVELINSEEQNGSILSKAEVLDVYNGSINTKHIYIIEHYFISNSEQGKAATVPSLYLPMEKGKQYLVNLTSNGFDIYSYTTEDFSCYPAEANILQIVLTESNADILQSERNDSVFVTVNELFDINNLMDVSQEELQGYISARQNSHINALRWLEE